MRFTLTLVRHGESEANVCHMLSGWMDVELTEKGTALDPVFEQISQGLFEKLTSKLTNQELETLNRLLQKCVE